MSNKIHSYKRTAMLNNPKIEHTTRAERKRAAQARLSVFGLLVRLWGLFKHVCFIDEVDGVKAKPLTVKTSTSINREVLNERNSLYLQPEFGVVCTNRPQSAYRATSCCV